MLYYFSLKLIFVEVMKRHQLWTTDIEGALHFVKYNASSFILVSPI